MENKPTEKALELMEKLDLKHLNPKQRVEALAVVSDILRLEFSSQHSGCSCAGNSAESPSIAFDIGTNLDKFIRSECQVIGSGFVGSTELYQRFRTWFRQNYPGAPIPSQKEMGSEMKQRFFRRRHNGRYKYYGITVAEKGLPFSST